MNDVLLEQQYEKAGYLTEPFRLFHIRDKIGTDISFHYHDFYKIIFFVEGDVEYTIEGKTYLLKPHDFVMVGANTIHRPLIRAGTWYERYVVYLSEEFLKRQDARGEVLRACFDLAQREQNRVVHFTPESYQEILECLAKMERISREEKEEAYLGDILLEAAFLEFMVYFNRCVKKQPKSFIKTAVYHEKVVDVIAYIQENLAQDINVDVLAEHFYISKYYLMRQFKQATGYSIHQYINEKRIMMAKRMIQAGMPASKACYESGFHDYSSFARRFKEIAGVSPSRLKF